MATKNSSSATFGGKRIAYGCSYCQRDITMQCRFHCAVCSNVHLCVDCFCVGIAFGDHIPSHDYRVIDCLDFPLFASDWTVQEELLLLEGIEKYGFGNWKSISDYIASKNSKQVEDHYYDNYIGVYGYCLPKTFLHHNQIVDTAAYLGVNPAITLPADQATLTGSSTGERDSMLADDSNNDNLMEMTVAMFHNRGECVKERNQREPVRHGRPPLNGGHSSMVATTAIAVTGTTTTTGTASGAAAAVVTSGQSIATPHAAAALAAELPGYIPLREDFDVEHDNDAELLLAEMEFARDDNPSERELKLQVIRIYNHKLDERNRRKRFVIDRGLVDVKKQHMLDKKRTKEDRELVARLKIFARFQTAEEHEALVEGLLKARKLRQQIEILQQYRSMGIKTLEQARIYDSQRKKRESEIRLKRQKDSAAYLFEGDPSGVGLSRRPPPGSRRGGTSSTESSQPESSPGLESSIPTSSSHLQGAPGGELLTAMELDFCGKLGLLPHPYLAIKDAIIREASRTGVLTAAGVSRMLKLPARDCDTIYDFFVKNLDMDKCSPRAVAPPVSQKFAQGGSGVLSEDASEVGTGADSAAEEGSVVKKQVGRKRKSGV